MSELNKTALFFVAAILAVGTAILTRPSNEAFQVDDLRGQNLLGETEFTADAAKRLRVTSVSKQSGDQRVFEVAETDGIWAIPSKSGYPADATEQMSQAVEGLAGRKILSVLPASSTEHVAFGVVDPSNTSATEGHGTRVQILDADDKSLADLIIGNEVKDSPGQYYVRKAEQDPVYIVEIDPENFSTDFGNWIEKDLLGLSPFDVRRVVIDDYATQLLMSPQGVSIGFDPKSKLELRYDEESSSWTPISLQEFDSTSEELKPFELGPDEELNEDTLRELRNALDDLVIVDVERKPDGLSADLRAGKKFTENQEAMMSLVERGFVPYQDMIFSSEGEFVCTLKNGVEYVLRFGRLQLDVSGDDAADAEAQEEAAEEDQGVNRYLFLMARFNEEIIPKPELEPLPELPADATAEGDEAGADGEESDQESTDQPEAEQAAAEGEASEDAAEEAESNEAAEIEEQRKIVEQANKRREEEYRTKVEEGRQRVDELNARFGDWYYVIPNEVYKKIHLNREQVITKKKVAEGESQEGADAADANPLGGILSDLPQLNFGQKESAEQPKSEEPAPEDEASSADATPDAQPAEEDAPESKTTEEPQPEVEPAATPPSDG